MSGMSKTLALLLMYKISLFASVKMFYKDLIFNIIPPTARVSPHWFSDWCHSCIKQTNTRC